jgi:hypothetical protein
VACKPKAATPSPAAWCINRGPTTSMNYFEPDKNHIELQIDNFDTVDEGRAHMESLPFRENPIGVNFDPDELVARFHAGDTMRERVRIE